MIGISNWLLRHASTSFYFLLYYFSKFCCPRKVLQTVAVSDTHDFSHSDLIKCGNHSISVIVSIILFCDILCRPRIQRSRYHNIDIFRTIKIIYIVYSLLDERCLCRFGCVIPKGRITRKHLPQLLLLRAPITYKLSSDNPDVHTC